MFERDENPIRDTSDDINVYEIDDSNCLWNYVNKISIQGRLYFSEKLKVDETNFTKNLPEDILRSVWQASTFLYRNPQRTA